MQPWMHLRLPYRLSKFRSQQASHTPIKKPKQKFKTKYCAKIVHVEEIREQCTYLLPLSFKLYDILLGRVFKKYLDQNRPVYLGANIEIKNHKFHKQILHIKPIQVHQKKHHIL